MPGDLASLLTTKVLPTVMALLVLLAPILSMAVVRLGPERLWPAQSVRPTRDGVNLVVWIVWMIGQVTLMPGVGAVATLAVNAVGGGLIVLPSRGLGLVVGAAVYLVAMDFGEFAFHRAQHAIPALWALHSLHHSDRAFDSTTTVRHFWADPLIKGVTIWLAVGLLFKATPAITFIYMVASYWNYAVHSNTRLNFGRWAWVLNSPGYHRIHHSSERQHFDVNFAGLLPIFDVICGTYRPARPGERPQTGLDTGDEPKSALDVAVWPIRGLVRDLWRRLRPPATAQA